ENLEEAVKKADDPKQIELLRLVREADQRENEADCDEALKTYQEIIEKAAGLAPETKKWAEERFRRLEPLWKPKSEAHKKAREYIYTKWPDLKTPGQLQKGLPEARKAFEVCRQENDHLAPLKLIKVGFKHTAALTKLLESLQKDDQNDPE